MSATITPEGRTAATTPGGSTGPVTLINSFDVPDGRDEEFQALWSRTSRYFRGRPGFVSLRLHRSVTPGPQSRWVNVAVWQSQDHFRAAHATEEFRRLVSGEGWQQFPSSPRLYQVVTAVG